MIMHGSYFGLIAKQGQQKMKIIEKERDVLSESAGSTERATLRENDTERERVRERKRQREREREREIAERSKI